MGSDSVCPVGVSNLLPNCSPLSMKASQATAPLQLLVQTIWLATHTQLSWTSPVTIADFVLSPLQTHARISSQGPTRHLSLHCDHTSVIHLYSFPLLYHRWTVPPNKGLFLLALLTPWHTHTEQKTHMQGRVRKEFIKRKAQVIVRQAYWPVNYLHVTRTFYVLSLFFFFFHLLKSLLFLVCSSPAFHVSHPRQWLLLARQVTWLELCMICVDRFHDWEWNCPRSALGETWTGCSLFRVLNLVFPPAIVALCFLGLWMWVFDDLMLLVVGLGVAQHGII